MKRQSMNRIKIALLITLFVLTVLCMAVAKDIAPRINKTQYYDDFKIYHKFENSFYDELEASTNSLSPNVGGEVRYEFDIPEYLLEGKSEEEIDRLMYQSLMSFSSQKGIEYYSYSREEYRVFIEASKTVYSKDDISWKPDIVFPKEKKLPTVSEAFVYQENASFGKGVRKVNAKYDEEMHHFYVSIVNLETVKYKNLIPISDPGEFVFSLLINRDGNHVSMYGIVAVQASAFESLRKRISYSIIYRVFALAQWFEDQSIETLKSQ